MIGKLLRGVTAGVLVLVASQFVYFSVFANGPVEISIVEKVKDEGSESYREWEDITNAMPGEAYSAIPRVRNDGEAAVIVKMCIIESAEDGGGNVITLNGKLFEIETNDNWILDKENTAGGNCYNYNEKLGVGELTEPLFTEVVLSKKIGNEYENNVFRLRLTAEAVEDRSNPDEEAEVKEEKESGKKEIPGSPDTGEVTAREAFLRNAGMVFLAAGVLVIVMSVIRRKTGVRRNREK